MILVIIWSQWLHLLILGLHYQNVKMDTFALLLFRLLQPLYIRKQVSLLSYSVIRFLRKFFFVNLAHVVAPGKDGYVPLTSQVLE